VGLDVPRGLEAIGYKGSDVGELVQGTLPQRRVLDLARELPLFTFPLLALTSSPSSMQPASRAMMDARSCRGSLSMLVSLSLCSLGADRKTADSPTILQCPSKYIPPSSWKVVCQKMF
jgi:hypothetical protein